MIVGRLTDDSWGKPVVQQLAADLQREFPGIGGFSVSNLWRMKAFFKTYAGSEKLAPLVREISWSHNLIILERCSDPLEREFYLRMTRKFGWSKNVLIHQIDNQSYETLLGQTNFDRTLTPELRAQAKLAVKDEYAFDFLELGAEHSERELERATSVSRISVSREVAWRAEPSATLAQPERAACVSWSYWRPHGSLVRSRKHRQKRWVPSCTTLAMIQESSRK